MLLVAHVAGLLLVSAARRQGELALRAVHGAGPGRLARLLAAESLLLTLGGAVVAGLFVAGLGLAALLLTAVGLGAVLAAWVAGLERELGVRLALGAERRQLGRLVARRSGTLIALGPVFGLALALLSGRFLAGLVYGVGAVQPGALAVACALLLLAALAGTTAPLLRALAADPLSVLRGE